MQKPYKSLQDVYLAESFAKTVPPLPRQTVLGEAKVKITFDDGRIKELETSDYTASKLLGVEAKATTKIDEEIKKWFTSGGWGEVATSVGTPILTTIIERNLKTNNTGVVREIIEDINNILKLKNTLSNFRGNLKSKGFNNFITNFPVKLKQLSHTNLIKDIERNLVFSEGNVAIGPGEVLATLYSEMTNPKTGDLMFPDGRKVELKGSTKEDSGGRPGKKNVVDAAARAVATLKVEYSKLKGEMDARLSTDLYEIIKPYKSVFTNFNGRLTANQKRFIDISSKILSNEAELGSILNSITNFKAFAKAGDVLTNSNIGTQIAEKLNAYKKRSEGKDVKTFRNYFNAEKNIDTLAEKIATFSVNPERINRNYLKDYLNKIGNGFNSNYAAKIVSAIQIADYQEEEKFSYIIFFNSLTNNQVVVGEFTQDYMTNLGLCLNKAAEFISVDPGTGGTVARGGFNVIV